MTELLLRFSDLKAMGVVRNWPTLKRWIESEKFPPGIMLGPNSRVWPKEQIAEWLAGRPNWTRKDGEAE